MSTFSSTQWGELELELEAEFSRASTFMPAHYELIINSAGGEQQGRHLFFRREEALEVLGQLVEGMTRKGDCIAIRVPDPDSEAVVVRLYIHSGGPAVASIELRPVS